MNRIEVGGIPDRSTSPSNLFRNLYLSFKFSQGIPEHQTTLFKAIVMEHPFLDIVWFSEHEASTVDDVRNRLRKLKIPKKHTEVLGGEYDTFSVQLFNYQTCLKERLPSPHDEPDEDLNNDPERMRQSQAHLVEKVLWESLRRDVTFQIESRPGRAADDDVHESLLKTYAIEMEPTGSNEFDSLFRKLHDLIEEFRLGKKQDTGGYPIREQLDKLVAQWEKRHPGEKFFPEETPET